MDTHLLLDYLDARRAPVSATGALMHRGLCEADADYYVTLLADKAAVISHKREVLANLLRTPRARSASGARIREALRELPPPDLLQVLDVLPARRINLRRGRTLLLELVLGHDQLALLAATHRKRLVRLLKHALGERAWSAVSQHLASPTPPGDELLQRKLLRYARDAALAREVLCFLAGVTAAPHDPLLVRRVAARKSIEEGAGLPRETLFGLRGVYHPDVPASRVRVLSAITQGAERHDGPLTALYKDALLEGGTPERLAALPAHVQAAVGALPMVDAHVAIVLDMSGSAASSGERAYHPAALGLALARILESRVRRVSVHQVGGSVGTEGHDLPSPQGATDLASALLTAAREAPQVALVITDGYENVRPGDAAQVAEGLRRLGHDIPIYQVVPLFAAGERLAQRRLGAPIQTLVTMHEGDVRELLARIALAAHGSLPPEEVAALARELVVVR